MSETVSGVLMPEPGKKGKPVDLLKMNWLS
jgi:hypothetical protein